MLANHLGQEFKQIEFVDMWQMFLVVFVRRTLTTHVQQVKKCSIPLGVLSMIGDKGGIMI